MSALAGKRVLVTRPGDDSRSLTEPLLARGAVPIVAPAIEILPLQDVTELDQALDALAAGEFEWVAFSSPRAVQAVAERLGTRGFEFPLAQKVASVGPATSERLRQLGVTPQFTASPHTTEALAQGFPAEGRGKVLLPRADIVPDVLEKELRARGYTPVRVDAYRTRVPPELPQEARQALASGSLDAMVFTSASTVRGFVTMAGVVSGPKVVCIGPVTAEEATRAGLAVDAVARPHTITGVLRALEDLFSKGPAR